MSADTAPQKVGTTHVASLDGLRFFAFLVVFLFHALQSNARLSRFSAYGALGVQVFFVLSGFLIGGILLDLRRRSTWALGGRLRVFYARRSLRIFPLYYMTLIALLLLELVGLDAVGGSDVFFWNASYLTNVKFFLDGEMNGGLSHLWSLAVEEHFYLTVPVLVLLLSIRQLSWLCVATWIFGGVGRAAFFLAGNDLGWVLSPLQFDCMAVGIAAAILLAEGQFLGLDLHRVLQISAVAAAAAIPLLALWQWPSRTTTTIGQVFDNFAVATASVGLILVLWRSTSPFLARTFTIGPLPYLGRISYGLYIFHLPCLVLVSEYLDFLPIGQMIPSFALTVGLAALSWRFLEAPANRLKPRYPQAGAPARC